jgi:hypothetical protein
MEGDTAVRFLVIKTGPGALPHPGVRGRPQAYPGVARPTLACRFILSGAPSGPRRIGGRTVRGFLFRLETPEGAPADPPTLEAAVPDWRPGHSIYFGGGRTLRVVGTRDDDADQPPVLIVEEAS